MKRSRRTGFTLLEVLVALALLALTAVLAWRATAALVDGEVRLFEASQRWRVLDLAFARLEADLRQAQPRAIRTSVGSEPAWLAALESHGASAIVISRAGAEFTHEPGASGQRIGYRLREGALEVVYWPGLDRASERFTAYRLVEDVAGFRVTHLASDGRWLAHWPQRGEPELPPAVRIELVMSSGETIERWFALR